MFISYHSAVAYKLLGKEHVWNFLSCNTRQVPIISSLNLYVICRWGGPLSQNWLDQQLALQKRILARMVELGMTPGKDYFLFQTKHLL